MGSYFRTRPLWAIVGSFLMATSAIHILNRLGCVSSNGRPSERTFPTQLLSDYSRNTQARSCQEKRHIYYIKVHKTGSGTLSNILLRFGLDRELTFALPIKGIQFLLAPLNASQIRSISHDRKYDLLIHHSVFNPLIKTELFHNETLTIASVREPFSLFLSSYHFFRYPRLVKDDLNISGYTVRDINLFVNHFYNRQEQKGLRLMNRMSFFLGIPFSKSRDIDYSENFVNSVLGKQLDFVTIQEYFDESLVLLKRKLCWRIEDIVYLPIHVRSDHSTSAGDFSSNLRAKHKKLAVAEYAIYDFFLYRFWQSVWKEGPDFYEEVRAFKILLETVQQFCSRNPGGNESVTIPESPWNAPFCVNGVNCRLMLLNDAGGINMILQKIKSQGLEVKG